MTAEDLMRVCLDLDQQWVTSRPSPWGDAAVLVSRLCHYAEDRIGLRDPSLTRKILGRWDSVDLSPAMKGVGPGSDQSTVALMDQLDEARMHRDRLAEACEVVLDRLDYLRNLWGDEAITHNVAERLRSVLRPAKEEASPPVDATPDDSAPAETTTPRVQGRCGMSATTHKERPILFSGPMVRALLEGRKTQTRRIVKGVEDFDSVDRVYDPGVGEVFWRFSLSDSGAIQCLDMDCPYGRIGDHLWVREAWAVSGQYKDGTRYEYRAFPRDGEHFRAVGRWKPSIHMPRCASRITLEITGVRVERVQDISPQEAWAEGVRCECMSPVPQCKGNVDAFARLWESINGPGSWERNDWVWALEFRRLQP